MYIYGYTNLFITQNMFFLEFFTIIITESSFVPSFDFFLFSGTNSIFLNYKLQESKAAY